MRLLFAILLIFPVSAKTYTTAFGTSENPLLEGGNWINGGTCTGCGVDWNNIKTTAGYAQTNQTLSSTGTDDGTALLAGTWGATQSVTITTKTPSTVGGTQEVEIRLRSTMTPHSSTGYEIDFTGGGTTLVRWNGAVNDFTTIGNLSNYKWSMHANPILKATIVGSTITAYDCSTGTCSSLGSLTETTYTTGNPGIGIDIANTTVDTAFGLTAFTASDGPTVSLSSSSIAFGNQAVGTPSAGSAVTLTNIGSGTLTVSSLTIGGTNAGDFATTGTNNCVSASPIAINGTCTITLAFTPGSTGARSGTDSIASDDTASPAVISLSGTGTSNNHGGTSRGGGVSVGGSFISQ